MNTQRILMRFYTSKNLTEEKFLSSIKYYNEHSTLDTLSISIYYTHFMDSVFLIFSKAHKYPQFHRKIILTYICYTTCVICTIAKFI